MKQIIRDYFTFNKRERRGIFVLLAILGLLMLYLQLAPHLFRQELPDLALVEVELEEKDAAEDSVPENYDQNDYKLRYETKKRYETRRKDTVHFRRPEWKKYPEKKISVVELNSADTLALDQLPGIGPAFARRIVKYRDLLGGFVSTRQLLEVYGFDSTRFDAIKNRLKLDTASVKKLNINTASLEELGKHPYIKYPLAKVILNYRKQHGAFASISDLKQLAPVSEQLYSRLRPYLAVE